MSRSRLAKFSKVTLAIEAEAAKMLGRSPVDSPDEPCAIPEGFKTQKRIDAIAAAVGRTFPQRQVQKKVEELATALNLAALNVATARRKAQKEGKHAD